jgi:hypothetical protein
VGKANSIIYRRRIKPEPMPSWRWEEGQRLLAELIAEAYFGDHPELFGLGEKPRRTPASAASADMTTPARTSQPE